MYNSDNEFCVVFFCVEWTESEDTMCWILSLPWLQVRLRGFFLEFLIKSRNLVKCSKALLI